MTKITKAMKKRIGLATIGQSPRIDITSFFCPLLGEHLEFVESGALDGLTRHQIDQLYPSMEDECLVSKLRDGSVVRLGHNRIIPLLQECIRDLEQKAVELTLVMCTGNLPLFDSKRLLILPQQILTGVLNGILPRGKLGVICPDREQVSATQIQFSCKQRELYVDWLSPYDHEQQIDVVGKRLIDQKVDLIFLDCFGFSPLIKSKLGIRTGKPIVMSSTLVARILRELVDTTDLPAQ